MNQKNRYERGERAQALGDERLSYIVHTAMLLVGTVQDVNQQAYGLEHEEKRDGGQRVRGAC